MEKKALIVVDYSVDFIAPDGKLSCGEPGQKLETFITDRIHRYIENNDNIFL